MVPPLAVNKLVAMAGPRRHLAGAGCAADEVKE